MPTTSRLAIALVHGLTLRSEVPHRIRARWQGERRTSLVQVVGGTQLPAPWLATWLAPDNPGVPINVFAHGDPTAPAPTCLTILQAGLCPCGAVEYLVTPAALARLILHAATLLRTAATPDAVMYRHRERAARMAHRRS